jgi:hypothetical protein
MLGTTMRTGRVGFALITSLAFVFVLRAQDVNPGQQKEPPKKSPSDYMSLILSRDTQPLGLKIDRTLERNLRKPSIQWAIRAAARHILD